MKLTVDPNADALYLRLNDADIVDSEQVASGVVVDYDAQDNIVGLELLHISKRGLAIEPEKLVFEILRPDPLQEAALREKSPKYGGTPPA